MTRAELNETSVAELRKQARQHGVVGASRMRKEDLVELIAAALGLPGEERDPLRDQLEALTVMQLRRQALDSGVRGAARMDKTTLVDLLAPLYLQGGSQPQPPAPSFEPPLEQSYHYPDSYGVDRVVLLVRDPEWLYAYWDISGDTWATLIQRGITHPGKGWRRALRLHDRTGSRGNGAGTNAEWQDIIVDDLAREWYFQPPQPDRVYMVEFGYLSPTGELLVIARSNLVHVPRQAPSDVMDEQWGSLYDEAYRLSLAGGDPTRVSLGSEEVTRRLNQLLQESISSGHFSAQAALGGQT